MDRVWVVMGWTGEYSDRSEWPVAAFMTEEAAQARVKALDEKMQEMPKEWRRNWDDREKVRAHMGALDPDYHEDYTGTGYFIYEVPVVA